MCFRRFRASFMWWYMGLSKVLRRWFLVLRNCRISQGDSSMCFQFIVSGTGRGWGIFRGFRVLVSIVSLFVLRAGAKIAINQLMYNLLSRGIEYEVLPLCAKEKIAIIGYSPLMQVQNLLLSVFHPNVTHFHTENLGDTLGWSMTLTVGKNYA